MPLYFVLVPSTWFIVRFLQLYKLCMYLIVFVFAVFIKMYMRFWKSKGCQYFYLQKLSTKGTGLNIMYYKAIPPTSSTQKNMG